MSSNFYKIHREQQRYFLIRAIAGLIRIAVLFLMYLVIRSVLGQAPLWYQVGFRVYLLLEIVLLISEHPAIAKKWEAYLNASSVKRIKAKDTDAGVRKHPRKDKY